VCLPYEEMNVGRNEGGRPYNAYCPKGAVKELLHRGCPYVIATAALTLPAAVFAKPFLAVPCWNLHLIYWSVLPGVIP